MQIEGFPLLPQVLASLFQQHEQAIQHHGAEQLREAS